MVGYLMFVRLPHFICLLRLHNCKTNHSQTLQYKISDKFDLSKISPLGTALGLSKISLEKKM